MSRFILLTALVGSMAHAAPTTAPATPAVTPASAPVRAPLYIPTVPASAPVAGSAATPASPTVGNSGQISANTQASRAMTAAPADPATTDLKGLQARHLQEINTLKKRLALLEQANQTALAQNQNLQLKNDNLGVQVEVLKSERSAQMFIYGALTFASGALAGLIIYSMINSRRRRSW